MSNTFNTSNKQTSLDSTCFVYKFHCCNKDSNECVYCGTNTLDFTLDDWKSVCNENPGQPIAHHWTTQIRGLTLPGKSDYGQIIRYDCTQCSGYHIERDYD